MIILRPVPTENKCPWNLDRRPAAFNLKERCMILDQILYPYFLGKVFGADYRYNAEGDCQVCCPAEFGVDTIVRMRPYDDRMKGFAPEDWRDVIFAEVINVNGECPMKYNVGDMIFFPTFTKATALCPAVRSSAWPFMAINPLPACINLKKLRCPDWGENVYYSLEDVDE